MLYSGSMQNMETSDRFRQALDNLVTALKEEPHVVAAILYGSVSYDVVWEQSDIDLVVVTDEHDGNDTHIELVQEEIPIHAELVTRNRFRERFATAVGGSLTHAMLAKSTLLFTRDPAVGDVLADLGHVGHRDRDLLLLVYGSHLIEHLNKSEKWLRMKDDPLYASVFLTGAVQNLARVVVLLNNEVPLREAIDQARRYEPELFDGIYRRPTTSGATHETVGTALRQLTSFVNRNAQTVFAAMLEFLSDESEARTANEVARYFEERWGGALDTGGVCRWLAAQGHIATTTARIRITSRGKDLFEQPAYYAVRAKEVLSL